MSSLSSSSRNENNMNPPPLAMHHTAIKTRNITLAIEFYSLLGFQVSTKFRAGPARAAWLEQPSSAGSSSPYRLELIEVPSYMLNEPEGMKRRAIDLMQRQDLLGVSHGNPFKKFQKTCITIPHFKFRFVLACFLLNVHGSHIFE